MKIYEDTTNNMPHGCVFNPMWLDQEEFKSWLQRWLQPVEKNDKNAFLKLCRKILSLDKIGVQALRSHVKGIQRS